MTIKKFLLISISVIVVALVLIFSCKIYREVALKSQFQSIAKKEGWKCFVVDQQPYRILSIDLSTCSEDIVFEFNTPHRSELTGYTINGINLDRYTVMGHCTPSHNGEIVAVPLQRPFLYEDKSGDCILFIDTKRKELITAIMAKRIIHGIYDLLWSNDNTKIAYYDYHDKQVDLCVYDFTTKKVNIIDSGYFVDPPQWSYNNRYLFYTSFNSYKDYKKASTINSESYKDYIGEISAYDFESKKSMRLFPGGYPAAQPNSKKFFFIVDTDKSGFVYTIDIDKIFDEKPRVLLELPKDTGVPHICAEQEKLIIIGSSEPSSSKDYITRIIDLQNQDIKVIAYPYLAYEKLSPDGKYLLLFLQYQFCINAIDLTTSETINLEYYSFVSSPSEIIRARE